MELLNLEAVCKRYNCEALDWLKWCQLGIVPKPDGAGLWHGDALKTWEAAEGVERAQPVAFAAGKQSFKFSPVWLTASSKVTERWHPPSTAF